ncbi:MAG TPA: hypothetical protein PLQ13_13160 [Candidatus Krumholzibacteria bacterium]|nr:hypothetical protein [Candidatus Krumholzibacteria bacterium]
MPDTMKHNREHLRRRALGALLAGAVILAVLPPSAARAQMGNDAVAAYIARTDELVEWAADLVGETDSGTARTVLSQASDMNRRAEAELGRGRAAQAMNLARRARAALWHSVKLAREAMGLEERLRLRAERYLDLHQELSERARDAGNEEAVQLLGRAEDQARRAREAHLQGDLRLAWQMFERAEEMTQRAARLIADGGDPERLQAEIERTAALIERAREAQHGEGTATVRRQLAEAEEALERARSYLDQGDTGRVLHMTTLARRLALAAFDSSAPAPVTAAERQIERFDERIAVVGGRVAEAGNDRARGLLDQARGHRERAGRALAAGDPELALREIRTAHDLLNQADTMLR